MIKLTIQNISLWNSDNGLEITAINYGIGNAGSILPLTDDFATTDVNVGTDTITLDIDLATGTGIKFTTTAADLPAPLVVGTLYFAIRVDATHIQVATTYANAVAGTEITLTDQGTGTHTVTMDNEYHIWNDKGNVLTSSPMTSVLVTVRDSDGRLVENITTQGWVEVKSLTIHAGDDGGAVGDYVDDNMANFQPIGKDNFVPIGSIPYDCYRKVQFRLRIPTSALTDGVSFKIYVTCQQPQVAIADWFTGIHGNGVIYMAAGAFGVSINGGDASLLDVEKGFALISTSSIYYGNKQQYNVSGLDNGTYKVYLTQAGVISSILEASEIPANAIELTRAVVVSGEATEVTDKRDFIMQRVISQHFQDLLAADVDGIHAAITGNGAIQNVTTAITHPDYARNASITVTNNDTPEGDVKLVGMVMGKNDEESITIIPGSTAYGNKPFDTVSKIVLPTGVSVSDTVTVGFSDKIGLDNPIVVVGDVFKKKVNNEDKTSELSTKVNATYNTVDCATIVVNEDMMLKYKSILTI